MPLKIENDDVTGEIALAIAPGTRSEVIAKQLDQALAALLEDAAKSLGVIVAAAPSRFARPLPGKDDRGRTRYVVRAARDGDYLVPAVSERITKRRR